MTESNSEMVEKAAAMGKARMLQVALHGVEELEARFVIRLQRAGLLQATKTLAIEDSDVVRAFMGEPTTRIPGPLYALTDESNEANRRRTVLDLDSLLYSDSKDVRIEVANHLAAFKHTSAQSQSSTVTTNLIREQLGDLSQDEMATWSRAADLIYDCVREDIFLNLAAFRVSIDWGYEEGIEKFGSRVLRPTRGTVEMLANDTDLIVTTVGNEERIEQKIEQIAASSNDISQVCQSFLTELGHLPPKPSLSLAVFLQDASPDQLQEVLKWGCDHDDPFASFHVSLALASHSERIPESDLPRVTEYVVRVLSDPDDEKLNATRLLMALRADLTKHFLDRVSLVAPDVGTGIRVDLASWLAGAICNAIGSDPPGVERFGKLQFKPEKMISMLAGRLVRNPGELSMLSAAAERGILLTMPLQYRFLQNIERFSPHLTDPQKLELSKRFLASYSLGLDLVLSEESLDIGTDYDALLQTWTESVDEEGFTEIVNQFQRLRASLVDAAALCEQLIVMGDLDLHEQLYAVGRLGRINSEEELNDLDAFLDKLIDEEWRGRELNDLEETVFDILVEALVMLPVHLSPRWKASIPNILASWLLQDQNMENRKSTLFGALVIYGCMTGSTAGLIRLLRSNKRAEFIDEQAFWSQQLGALSKIENGWTFARMRPVINVLENK